MTDLTGGNPLLPNIATIASIRRETGDVKTFQVVFDDPLAVQSFAHKPGQVALISVFGEGEATISITSSPTVKGFLEFSIKKVGRLTSVLHEIEAGAKVAVRGPYGNGFPLDEMKGKNLLFVGGGIGLAPLRSLIDYVLAEENRSDYGNVEILYGARSMADICFKEDLFNKWTACKDTRVYTTIDREEPEWSGHVGFVPAYLEEIKPVSNNKVAITCGPPVMIKFILMSLQRLGFTEERIITTLEMKMKCGIGKCGRCNIGSKYVCLDGPVFTLKQLKELPPEF
ncbi:oxidoreductase FAD/NAD(P)-binding domain protein [Desulfofarcimen acetoxidans DSM 771]|uniref:Oxidoreductase FAD/NAD(P)-binding domain protein n=1 Tax=Desulfofarcimen acetoxidans (strain ATCC 49208 / DSM 771 / KCTC 5769 / VKM B-1644 / 5575) TaxID=485916 RepID=C8W6E5_DESAS|nr:FAD/NAD(P)-binding protein [Desulfofarcimen acetoxidans]ACV62234.1 oxidoreductase FAD/NAD(P)-binding domain protein [Desulfofarcimen acetoxidans DSM 771]